MAYINVSPLKIGLKPEHRGSYFKIINHQNPDNFVRKYIIQSLENQECLHTWNISLSRVREQASASYQYYIYNARHTKHRFYWLSIRAFGHDFGYGPAWSYICTALPNIHLWAWSTSCTTCATWHRQLI